MSLCKCQKCGDMFDRSEAADQVDSEFTLGAYEYHFQWNDFCYECAMELIEEDE